MCRPCADETATRKGAHFIKRDTANMSHNELRWLPWRMQNEDVISEEFIVSRHHDVHSKYESKHTDPRSAVESANKVANFHGGVSFIHDTSHGHSYAYWGSSKVEPALVTKKGINACEGCGSDVAVSRPKYQKGEAVFNEHWCPYCGTTRGTNEGVYLEAVYMQEPPRDQTHTDMLGDPVPHWAIESQPSLSQVHPYSVVTGGTDKDKVLTPHTSHHLNYHDAVDKADELHANGHRHIRVRNNRGGYDVRFPHSDKVTGERSGYTQYYNGIKEDREVPTVVNMSLIELVNEGAEEHASLADPTKTVYHKTLVKHGFNHEKTEHKKNHLAPNNKDADYTQHIYRHPNHGKSYVVITQEHKVRRNEKPHSFRFYHEQENGIMAPCVGDSKNQLDSALSREYGDLIKEAKEWTRTDTHKPTHTTEKYPNVYSAPRKCDLCGKKESKTDKGKHHDTTINHDFYKDSPEEKKRIASRKEESVSKKDETKFHKKLDKLVHNTFGKRKDESFAEPSMNNPAFLGNAALNDIACNQPANPDYDGAMVKPKDRKGTYATPNNSMGGVAPDTTDIHSLPDPALWACFKEEFNKEEALLHLEAFGIDESAVNTIYDQVMESLTEEFKAYLLSLIETRMIRKRGRNMIHRTFTTK
jgi:hypothetical protein